MVQFGSALDLPQMATPANPAASRQLVYAKSDGKVYTKTSAGVESLVGPLTLNPLIVTELRTGKIDSNPPGSADIVFGSSVNAAGNTFYGFPTPVNADWAATKGYVDSLVGSGVPTGSMTMFAGTSAPSTGWLLCDGSSQLIATYPALSAVIRAQFGGVDGTHFYLPDMQGRFPVGANPGATLQPSLQTPGGTETTTSTTLANRELRLNHAHTHDMAITGAANATTGGTANRVATVAGALSGTATTTSAGVGGATANLNNHAFTTVNFLIKT